MFGSGQSERNEPLGQDDAIALIRRGLALLAGEERTGWSAAARSARLVDLVELGERLDAETVRAAAAWDAGADWALDGSLSPRAWLCRRVPLSGLEASRLVRAARLVRTFPATGEALASGRVSAPHVQVIARMARRRAAEYTDAEAVLIDVAESLDVEQFTKAAQVWCDLVDEQRDPPGTGTTPRQELHVHRIGNQGVVQGDLDPDTTRMLVDALDLAAPPDPAGRPEGVRSLAQRRADALHDVCAAFVAAHHHDNGRPPHLGGLAVGLHIVMDHDTYLGHLDPTRDPRQVSCELVGFGPITPATAWRLVCDCDIGRLVVGADSEILDLGRSQRYPSRAQRRALEHRDRGCVWPGCDRPSHWCQAHHLRWWEHDGPTDLANLALLCRQHHSLCHEGGWTLTRNPDHSFDVTPPPAGHTPRPHPGRAPPRAA